MRLTHNGILRTESDETVIATLLRKGWVEAPPEPESEPVPEPVPQQVTKRQWRLYCKFDRGIADPDTLVHGAIDQYVPEAQRAYAHEDYSSTYFIDRTNPLVAALAPQLGIADLDEAFRQMAAK